MSGVTFTIPGKPHAKQRPRFSRRSGRAFTPKETVSFEQTVSALALPHFPKPAEGPVKLTIWATFEVPASWSKKKKAAHVHRPHCGAKDIDNVAKSILDGLNRIAFADDRQVFELNVRKMWGTHSKTVVTVEEMMT